MNLPDQAGRRMEALFRLYEQKMYRVALAILGDPFQAEDAVMDAFLRIWKGGFRIDDPLGEPARRLVLAAVKSASIDLYRKNRRDRARQRLTDVLPERPDAAPTETPGDMPVAELLALLPDDARIVLEERILHGRSAAETARRLGITEAAVRKRQERALKKLRSVFSEGGFL